MYQKILKVICLLSLVLTIQPSFVFSQETDYEIDTEHVRPDSIYVEEEIIDAEVFIRVPESSVQPRTRTEELNFTLNYLRRVLIESNKELY